MKNTIRMTVSRVLVLTAFAGMILAGRAAEIDLAGSWRLAGTNEKGQSVSCPIAVPGDVHSALRGAGLLPDPFFGANETNVLWVGQREWTVSRDFAVDAALLREKAVVLRLEDVDTFCTVYVNGQKVGVTDNRFRRWEFDVKPFLREGANTVVGVFADVEETVRRLRAASPVTWQFASWMNGRVVGMCQVRKPQCHSGWDWGICQMVVGFCGDVRLIASDWRIDYVYTEQHFNRDRTHCDLDVIAELTDADGTHSAVTNRIAIDNPRLWWPNGQGEQHLTPWTVDVRGRKVSGRTGLREIEFVAKRDWNRQGEMGRSCFFRVNGRDVFMKGANWIPCDAFDCGRTTERYRDLLTSARDANMNMIRVWGGGQFERDAFYDLCDELGILLWHDMMFACSNYPDDDAFFASVKAEVTHQVKRLRNHAAIALWCGDNECIQAVRNAAGDESDQELYVTAYARRRLMLKRTIAAADPTRRFWPSSPCREEGDFERRSSTRFGMGDDHYWGVWHSNKDFESFYDVNTRFCSEFGFQSFSSPEVARTFSAADPLDWRAPDFQYHQKNRRGNQIIVDTFKRYFKEPTTTRGVLYLSQVQQALAIKTGVEHWRSIRPWCMGALYWQLNDNWPVASWSSIEYGGKWKQLHHQARRFFAPVGVAGFPNGKVVAFNDTPKAEDAELTVEAWRFDGTCPVRSLTVKVRLAPNGVTSIGEWPESFWPRDTFLALTLRTSHGEFRNDVLFKRFKDYALPDARIVATFDGLKLTLKTDRPAFYVWANVEGARGEFSDNSLTLLPGRPVTVEFRPKGKLPPQDAFERLLTVMDLSKAVNEEQDETAAIQARIDACFRKGGGEVRLAKGAHPVKSIRLRSNVTLHLERDARLVASRFPEDYAGVLENDALEPLDPAILADAKRAVRATNSWHRAIIRIFNAKNVAIVGEPGSEIDGRNCYDPLGEEKLRGPHAIVAQSVTNLTLRGYSVRDAGNYGLYTYQAADVNVSDLTIRGGHDGLDFFWCDRVRVERCDIESGDDCVAGHSNRDWTIRDCRLNTSCSIFRIGGNGVRVENIDARGPGICAHRQTFRREALQAGLNPTDHGRRNTLSFFTFFASKTTPDPAGDMKFSNCRVSGVDKLMHLNLSGSERWQQGFGLDDVTFEDMTFDGLVKPGVIYDTAESPLKVKFKNVKLSFREPVEELFLGANVKEVKIRGLDVKGAKGPFLRSWNSTPKADAENLSGIEFKVEPTTGPFKVRSI